MGSWKFKVCFLFLSFIKIIKILKFFKVSVTFFVTFVNSTSAPKSFSVDTVKLAEILASFFVEIQINFDELADDRVQVQLLFCS